MMAFFFWNSTRKWKVISCPAGADEGSAPTPTKKLTVFARLLDDRQKR